MRMQKPDSLTSQYGSLVDPCVTGNKILYSPYLALQLLVSASQEPMYSIEFSQLVSYLLS
jgi:hypothetical protein